MKDNTIYIDVEKLPTKNTLKTNSILILAVYNKELPLQAKLVYFGHTYEIKQHTMQVERKTLDKVYIYICEETNG